MRRRLYWFAAKDVGDARTRDSMAGDESRKLYIEANTVSKATMETAEEASKEPATQDRGRGHISHRTSQDPGFGGLQRGRQGRVPNKQLVRNSKKTNFFPTHTQSLLIKNPCKGERYAIDTGLKEKAEDIFVFSRGSCYFGRQ